LVITARLRPGKKGFLVSDDSLMESNEEFVRRATVFAGMKSGREAIKKIASDEAFRHDLGCTCAFCDLMRTRYAAAPIDSPEDFARAGGEHQDYPFQAEQTQHFASIANSLKIVAGAVVGLQNIFRGRDADNAVVQSPYRVLVDFIVSRVQAPTPEPSTQRAPATAQPAASPVPRQQAQAQLAPAQPPAQAPLFGAPANTKAIATDAQMQQMLANLTKFTPTIRFDSKTKWPGESQKGRKIIVIDGHGNMGTEVDPAYLDIYADSLDYFAGKAKEKVAAGTANDNDKKDAQFNEILAARCRRIAILTREGKIQRIAVAAVQTYSGGGGDYE
jgi:hypothetical protein